MDPIADKLWVNGPRGAASQDSTAGETRQARSPARSRSSVATPRNLSASSVPRGAPRPRRKLAWIVKEIGDSLWSLSEFASDLGVDLEEVARLNLRKLAERYGLDDPKIVPFPRKSADQAPAPKLGTAPVVVDGELLVIVLREFWTGEGNAGELEAVESAAVESFGDGTKGFFVQGRENPRILVTATEIPAFSNCANWAPAGARARARARPAPKNAAKPGPFRLARVLLVWRSKGRDLAPRENPRESSGEPGNLARIPGESRILPERAVRLLEELRSWPLPARRKAYS